MKTKNCVYVCMRTNAHVTSKLNYLASVGVTIVKHQPLRLNSVSVVGNSKSPTDENVQAAIDGIHIYLCIKEEEEDFIEPTVGTFASITATVQ